MKNLQTTKGILSGIAIGLIIAGTGTFAATTGAGTIGSLFNKIGTNYRLYGDNIQDNTVDESELESGSVGSSELQSNAVLSNHIRDREVRFSDLGYNSVSNIHLMVDSVRTAEIKNGEVQKEDLAVNSVDSSKVVLNSLKAEDLAPNSVGNSELQSNLYLGRPTADTPSLSNQVATKGYVDSSTANCQVEYQGRWNRSAPGCSFNPTPSVGGAWGGWLRTNRDGGTGAWICMRMKITCS